MELNKYKVTYDANGGSGTVTDSKSYAGGTNCYADVQSGSGLKAPEGKVFLYWNTNADGSGTTYYPDDKVQVTSDVTLYAVYGDIPEVTDLTYNSNYPSDTGLAKVTTMQLSAAQSSVLLNNQDLTVYSLTEAGMSTPKGYEFAGWNTKADGTGTLYSPGALIGVDVDVDVDDPQPNELYAIWVKKPTKDVFKSSDTSTSIDGNTVKAGDELLYTITYENTTGSSQTVTITDSIPANSTYIEESSDNEGVFSNGTITWSDITLSSGNSITVSFKVTVNKNDGTKLENQASISDGTNTYTTNATTNPTPEKPKKDVFKSSDTSTSIDGDTVEAGDELFYKITYTNTTGSEATVDITDSIPDNSSYVDGSADNGGTYADGKVTWNDITLADGESITVSFKVKVGDDNGTALKNQASVIDGDNTYTTNETTNPTGENPKKSVFESDDENTSIDGDTVKAGDELLYKITYTNTTGSDASVDITDSIPENSTYVDNSADKGGTYADGKVTWNDIELSSGETITVSFKVTVDKNNGTVLDNYADVTVGSNTYTTNETKNPTPEDPTKDVFRSSDTSSSIDGDLVEAGDELLYKITYKNTTGSDQTVTITDSIPKNSTYVEDSADNEGTYAAGTVTWKDIELASGESITVSFKVKVDKNNGIELDNQAAVNDGTNTYTTNETKNPTPDEPEKDVFKSSDENTSIDGDTVKAGDELLYKITYKNTTGAAQTIKITDKIPDNSKYVDDSADNSGTYSDGTVTWDNITLAADDSITVSFKVTVKENNGTKLSNQASVGDGTNTYTTNETTNPTPDEPDKDVFKSSDEETSIDGDAVKAGDELLYKITYNNTTGAEQTVTITDDIPDNSTYVTGSVDNGGSYSNGKITWSNITLAAGGSITVSFKVRVKENNGTALANQASVSDGTNTYTTNETRNPTPEKPTKDVFQSTNESTSIDGETVQAGDELIYKITYENTTGTEQSITITDEIPENATYVDGSADNDGSYSNGKITWSDITLANGEDITVSFKVKVDKNNGTELDNQASVSDGTNTYLTNETTNPTPEEPTKVVFKSSDPSVSIDGKTVKAGDELIYKITYNNTTGSEQSVTITDAIPDNSTYVDGSADNDGSYSNGSLTWSGISVQAGKSITVSFKVKVKENNGTALANQASVSDGTNTYTTNETNNPTPTDPEKDVYSSSDTSTSIDGSTVKAGDELVYKITYNNTTGSDQTVTITDSIPENSTYVDGSADNGGSYEDGQLTWSGISVENGDSITVSFHVKVKSDDGVTLKNTANVNDGTNDYKTNETTNPLPEEPVPEEPEPPAKDVFRSSDENTSIDSKTVYAGDELLYKITYKNTTSSEQKITIKDQIPENSSYVDGSADNNGTYSNGKLTWSDISVEAGKSITVSFKVKVKANNGTALKNKAYVTSGTNTYTTNETSNPTPDEPEKDVFKSSNEDTSIDGKRVKAGEELLYRITYRNTTGSDQTVTIKDHIPENAEYVVSSADKGGRYTNGSLTWSDIKLAEGESVTVSFKVKVKSNNGKKLKNQAVVNDGENTYTTNETVNPTRNKPNNDDPGHTDKSNSDDPGHTDKSNSDDPGHTDRSKAQAAKADNVKTGDGSDANMYLALLLSSALLLAILAYLRRDKNKKEGR